ncbi:MAG: hypothetical protein F6J98_24135 [Moorea sp. SIO4G2]|nr:hypothetical protein [Moorena sp. SIO4G2]
MGSLHPSPHTRSPRKAFKAVCHPVSGGNITASGQALKERFLKLLLAYVTDTAATLGLAKTHLQHVITATAINQSTSVGLGSRDSSPWYSHF